MSSRGSLRLSTSVDGGPWDDTDLIEELTAGPQAGGHWSVWNWDHPEPIPPPLEILIAVPEDGNAASSVHEFLDAVSRQLRRAFGLFCAERGWPQPGFKVRRVSSSDHLWLYRISLPGGPAAEGVLKPNKLMAMGDPKQLSPFLGLETVDPVLGLPAKWIGRSQLELAQRAELHVFDGPGLITAHTLHLAGEIWHRVFGFLEIQRWLLAALPDHHQLIAAVMPAHTGLFLRTIKELVADRLWLPHPTQLLELFLRTLPELDAEEPLDGDLLKELMRKDVVPLNLQRFSNPDGMLRAVEWRGEPEGDDGDQARLLTRLSEAVLQAQEQPGSVIVLTDFENRLPLSRVLSGPFPYLPVFSWAELPAHARVDLAAVVDAKFDLDPSPWPHATFGRPD